MIAFRPLFFLLSIASTTHSTNVFSPSPKCCVCFWEALGNFKAMQPPSLCLLIRFLKVFCDHNVLGYLKLFKHGSLSNFLLNLIVSFYIIRPRAVDWVFWGKMCFRFCLLAPASEELLGQRASPVSPLFCFSSCEIACINYLFRFSRYVRETGFDFGASVAWIKKWK